MKLFYEEDNVVNTNIYYLLYYWYLIKKHLPYSPRTLILSMTVQSSEGSWLSLIALLSLSFFGHRHCVPFTHFFGAADTNMVPLKTNSTTTNIWNLITQN